MVVKKTNKVALVAKLAGLTAAAVGAYYLYGHKDAVKHRAMVKGWMLKAKGEVLEELEKVSEITESAYMAAVDAVVKKYHELKTIDAAELESFMNQMKDHWHGIKKSVMSAGKPKKSTAKKAKK